MTTLRRNATFAFGAAAVLFLAALPFPFAERLGAGGIAVSPAYAILALVALATAALLLNLERRSVPSAAVAVLAVVAAAVMALNLPGLVRGIAAAVGFSLYLAGTGAAAGAGLLAFAARIEEHRHGPTPRTFRADGPDPTPTAARPAPPAAAPGTGPASPPAPAPRPSAREAAPPTPPKGAPAPPGGPKTQRAPPAGNQANLRP